MSRPNKQRPAKRGVGSKPQSNSQGGTTFTSRRWIWMVGGVAGLVAIIALALSATSQQASTATVARDAAAAAQGAELFAASCAVCHGTDLRGTITGPPFLDVIYAPNHHGDEAFQRAVLGGVVPHHWDFGPMPAIPGLSRDQVALIVEYVRSQQEAAGILRDPSHP